MFNGKVIINKPGKIDDDFILNHFGRVCLKNNRTIRWFESILDLTIVDDIIFASVSIDNTHITYDENGEYHSYDDNPAYNSSRVQIWYKHGKQHRENNLPSTIREDGLKEWRVDNKFHRTDYGPTRVINHIQEWIRDGEYHREDGPAKIYKNNEEIEFWINGYYISEDVEQWMEENNIPDWPDWTDEIKVLFKLTFC